MKIEPPVTGCDNFHDVTTECENACGMHPSQSSSLNIQMLVRLYKQKLEMEIGRNVFFHDIQELKRIFVCLQVSSTQLNGVAGGVCFQPPRNINSRVFMETDPGVLIGRGKKKKKHAHKMPLSIVITQHVTKWSSEALWCR